MFNSVSNIYTPDASRTTHPVVIAENVSTLPNVPRGKIQTFYSTVIKIRRECSSVPINVGWERNKNT